MPNLPLLIDAEDAVEFYQANPTRTDAVTAYIVGILSEEGMTNREIREALNIHKVYTVTHFKRAGSCLSQDELNLWHSNPTRITLGHVRAIAKLGRSKREEMLRRLLSSHVPVSQFERMARGEEEQQDSDMKVYERQLEETLGRGITISFNPANQYGKLTLDFHSLEDLDELVSKLGFSGEDEFY